MKKLLLVTIIGLTFAGCTGSTQYGECVGVADDKDPKLTYSLSKWNVFLGIVFSETLIVPGIVIFKQLECPRGTK